MANLLLHKPSVRLRTANVATAPTSHASISIRAPAATPPPQIVTPAPQHRAIATPSYPQNAVSLGRSKSKCRQPAGVNGRSVIALTCRRAA